MSFNTKNFIAEAGKVYCFVLVHLTISTHIYNCSNILCVIHSSSIFSITDVASIDRLPV